MNSINWTKKNGNPLRTNDLPATIAYCEKLGMTREGTAPNVPIPDDTQIPGENQISGEPVTEDTPVVADPTPYPG